MSLETIKRLARLMELALTRKRHPIRWNDLSQSGPISRHFGLERGTSVSRYYVDSFIQNRAELILGRGLEVGEIKYLSMHGDRITSSKILVPSLDALHKSANIADAVIADLQQPESMPADQFETFVCTQTLLCTYDVKAAIASCHKVLAAGGTLIGTVPGIAQISRFDMDRWGDYWRFTPASTERLLRDVFGDAVQVTSMGNALAATMLMQGIAVEDLTTRSLLDEHDRDYPVIIGFTARKR